MLIRNHRRRDLPAGVFSAIVASIVFSTVSTAYSQSQSLFGTRGPASQIGSNLRGSVVGQGSTFGTTNGGTLNGQPITGAAGSTPQGANSGIVGRANTGRFVGNQRTGQQANNGNSTPTFSSFGNRSSQRTGMSFGDDQSFGGRTRTERLIRPRQKVAFDFPRFNEESINSSLNTRFQKLSSQQKTLSRVRVSVDENGTATLVGSVDNPESARLAEMMARLEPGVRVVQSELRISQDEEESAERDDR